MSAVNYPLFLSTGKVVYTTPGTGQGLSPQRFVLNPTVLWSASGATSATTSLSARMSDGTLVQLVTPIATASGSGYFQVLGQFRDVAVVVAAIAAGSLSVECSAQDGFRTD